MRRIGIIATITGGLILLSLGIVGAWSRDAPQALLGLVGACLAALSVRNTYKSQEQISEQISGIRLAFVAVVTLPGLAIGLAISIHSSQNRLSRIAMAVVAGGVCWLLSFHFERDVLCQETRRRDDGWEILPLWRDG